MSASRAGGNTPLGPNAAGGVGASEADAPYPDAVPPSEGSTFSSSAGSEQDQAVLWGTNIAVHESMRDFRRFLTEFRLETEPADAEPYYMRLLAEIHESQTFNINIDCKNLHDFPATRRLYEQLERYPAEIIPILDLVVHQEYLNMFGPDSLDRSRIQVRTFNLREVKTMRDLNPEDIDQMVAVRGMITRTSAVLPDIKLGFFRCSACQGTMEVMLDRGKIQEPSQCPHCQEKWSMELVHNRCWFADKQMIKLQEAPENIAEGETPTTMTLYAFDDLVDVGRPGDRVEVTGIFRAVPVRSNPRRRSVHSVYKTYIDVIHFRKSAKGRLTAEDATAEEGSEFHTTFDEGDETTHIRDERRARLEELSRDPEIYNKLTAALAPSIWELDDVKKGVLLMLFGGVHKKIVNKSLRGEINVLLCGDPGTSKSQLLSYVHKIAPRGLYTSGKGTSAVGLTAYVYKDPETKELTLESGALVLSDRGVCCIDEFDKMSDSARSILHEAMEQQTVSIAKAGIIATLNARTSVLASANPIESRYNPSMSIVENINLTPTLLSRFDLIYLILDKPNAETDRRLARHLVALFYKEGEARRSETLEPRLLAEYISYARRHIHPDISEEAAAALVEGYVDMRLVGTHANRGKKLITATPRQLESLIRLSEAHARLHFRRAVLREDVEEAVRLMNVATQRAATDPTTGTIDMDMITTGHTAAARQLIQVLAAEVRNMLASNMRGKTVTFMEIQRAMESDTVTVEPDHLEEALRHLADANVIVYNEMTRAFHVAEVF